MVRCIRKLFERFGKIIFQFLCLFAFFGVCANFCAATRKKNETEADETVPTPDPNAPQVFQNKNKCYVRYERKHKTSTNTTANSASTADTANAANTANTANIGENNEIIESTDKTDNIADTSKSTSKMTNTSENVSKNNESSRDECVQNAQTQDKNEPLQQTPKQKPLHPKVPQQPQQSQQSQQVQQMETNKADEILADDQKGHSITSYPDSATLRTHNIQHIAPVCLDEPHESQSLVFLFCFCFSFRPKCWKRC